MTYKVSIIYFSKTGTTGRIANVISEGIISIPEVEVKTFDIDNIDYKYLDESIAVIFGTPTYYANTCWQIKKWFDESFKYNLEGKLGAVFATCDYVQGGADTAILTIINHLMVKGMLVYSGGSAVGKPYFHLGAVYLKGDSESDFFTFGKRIAQKAKDIVSIISN